VPLERLVRQPKALKPGGRLATGVVAHNEQSGLTPPRMNAHRRRIVVA
jgi:hypothetical protein